jgi:peptidoglycan hydrolase-like protein with peptidoglycan-binding domain
LRSLKTIGLVSCFALAFTLPGWAGTKPKPVAKTKTPAKTSAKTSAKAKPGANVVAQKGKKVVKGKKGKPVAKRGAWKRRGQQSIASERTLQIQEALVNAGYLTAEPSGKMDAQTKQALVKLQKENGWQTKVVPDSRALIRLGLGPDHSNLLNPDTAVLPEVSSAAGAPAAPPPPR